MDTATPGFRVGKREKKMGLRGSDTVEVVFEDCVVPDENLLGEQSGGFKAFMRTLTGGRISIGALALGLAQGAYEHSLEYAKERKQFDQPIANFQAVQFMLADMATKIEASRLLVYHAALLKDAGQPFVKEASMAKLFASETANWVTDKAIQIHGGIGYCATFRSSACTATRSSWRSARARARSSAWSSRARSCAAREST